jgi:glycosyltransferase involved in cell wall biosynthesis
MNIGLDISPLQSGHVIRGVGFYVQNLKKSLELYDKENHYSFLNTLENADNLDILHIPYLDPFFVHLPLRKKCKLVVTVHDLTPLVFPKLFPTGIRGRVKWEINKKLLNNVDAIITQSDCSNNDIQRFTGISKEKIHTVYTATGEEFKQLNIPKTMNQELRTKYKLPEKFVLYVGDVTPNKNLPALVDAIKTTKHTLVMVGKSLANREFDRSNALNNDLIYIQEQAENNPQIKILGFVDQQDLVALYNIATVSILPSLYEGFGLPLLEAMQSGCPVITTKGGSLPEVAGDAAYFVDPTSVESIANGINEVMGDAALQKSLINKGLKQAEKFTWKKSAEQTVNVYKKIYAEK